MTRETGRLLRRLGLVIEAIAICWVILVRRRIIAPANLEGTDPVLIAKVALLTGAAIWLVGTILIYWPRKSAKPPKQGDEVD